MQVQIPAYTDRWMMGDRTGTIVGGKKIPWESIHESIRPRGYKAGDKVHVSRVKLDKSGKTITVISEDCT
ncbi:hypothetical protein [Mesorhizobium sp. M7A.F.Ca.MR.362.00.0.0]|uniref:hypothetical protein n=1 Tax=Mesorhizobium sp. M7A.F.Ca.MR.362.00.0.0 TaxID=2496779 RepID=UPI000FD38F33|nr:hypothetical protein [Mesorhizobium sp. M7A.F.Ca.MR.362.00.0.0]RUU78226.1 hypothetical protein EOC06_20640 [Mesorhizobium sp. M7A.F.Ca.MR.362.00.0.0]RWN95416.1 MAG: hypothetical protein EOS05_11525 [Mesorhizobium sp.]